MGVFFSEVARRKKGLSEIVSYVLLILISLTIAGMIYAGFVNFVPKDDTPKCPNEVSLIVSKFECDGDKVKLTFLNKGTFDIIRFHAQGSDNINAVSVNQVLSYGICSSFCGFSNNEFGFCGSGGGSCVIQTGPLSPGSELQIDTLKLNSASGGVKQVRITPIVSVTDYHGKYGGNRDVICWDKSIVVKTDCP
jgi:hypothetical protein